VQDAEVRVATRIDLDENSVIRAGERRGSLEEKAQHDRWFGCLRDHGAERLNQVSGTRMFVHLSLRFDVDGAELISDAVIPSASSR
jgi:hypothetical protein